ncbi:MAG TPA: M24 family metallopeptidase, partial [candidate division Zixibacteria bacterium]|nr:M24 family metallopeptidase [candidate division Zixibacteria bacterium]
MRDLRVAAWLLYDFHGLNPLAHQVAGIRGIITRRWFALIRAEGEPQWLVHQIERAAFEGQPGEIATYGSHGELKEALTKLLSGVETVAMEYSPKNAIPYVARVDAGTIETVQAHNVAVTSSADLIARLLACWSPEQVASHREAAKHLNAIKDAAFALIGESLRDGKTIREYDVVKFIHAEFEKRGMETESGPIVGVGPHSGDPHYDPHPESSQVIAPGNLVLI